jgi:hypothetical protein
MSWQGSASHHKKRLAAGRLQTGFLQLTFTTPKPLFLLALKTVAKLTIFATATADRTPCTALDDIMWSLF